MIVGVFAEQFGHQPESIRIRWTEQLDVAGTLYGCGAIWLTPRTAPSGSSLAHELAHCFADHYSACGLCTDDTHSERWIWGDDGIVQRVNKQLSQAGL